MDTAAPIITLNGDATVTVAVGASYTDAGVTVTDNKDTGLTAMVTYTKDGTPVAGIDTKTVETYIIHYNATDSSGNKAAEVIRTVIVAEADTTAPVITLKGDATVTVANGASYTDAGVTVTDNKDTGLTATVTYTKDGAAVSGIDTKVAGTYVIHYNATDSSGNKAAEVIRTVIVAEADTTAPVITLKGDATVTVVTGTDYTDAGVTATDNIDGTVAVTNDSITAVNTSKAGTYTVTYTAKDAAGNTATAKRTVIVTNTLFEGRTEVSNTENTLVGGAKEYTIISTDSNNWSNTSYLCEANTIGNSNYKIMSCYGYYDGSKPQMVTLTDQAAAAQAYFDKTPGYENYKVVGIINADFFDMANGAPSGALVMNGIKYHDAGSENYFAILKDGTPVIREGNISLDDCKSAVGGSDVLLKDGVIEPGLKDATDGYRNIIYSRSAIGIKKDGTVVTLCTHGFTIPESYGLTFYDVAEYLKSMGCVDALMLDGGGSTEWCSMYEGTNELKVRNTPSDGNERLVSSSIILVSTATASNEFDHATITPNNEIYTPGSTVQFTASGVSKSGSAVLLPQSGLTWELGSSSNNMGTIDAVSGVFTAAKGITGNITVNLLYDQETIGSTTITLSDPDNIYFNTDAINLDWGQNSNLGLNVKSNSLDVNYKDGDFTWTVASTTSGVDNIGSVSNNVFTAAASSQTLTGTVTILYTKADGTKLSDTINVEIGKLPVTLMDFEGEKDGEKAAQYCWGTSVNGYGYNDDSVVSPVTVNTSGTYTGNPVQTTLEKPYIFTGQWDEDVPAAPIFQANGYNYYTWANSGIPNPEDSTAQIVSSTDGKVRFGDRALTFNYDFTKFNFSCNGNIAIRYCGKDIDIEGTPTALGMWVYAPQGTPNYWLVAFIYYWNGSDYSSGMLQFKTTAGTSPQYTGINWSGWMYLEADLSSIYKAAAEVNSQHPLKILSGGYIADLIYVRSTSDGNGNNITCGSKTAGTIYIDNIRAVYGCTADDLVNPVISSITADGTEIKNDNSTVITSSNTVHFIASYSDPDSANASGIDTNSVSVEIDGIKRNTGAGENTADVSMELPNGNHSITVNVADKFGNMTTETRYFTVNAAGSSYTSMALVGKNTPVLGGKYDLELTSSKLDDLSNVALDANFDKEFGTPAVNFADGYTGSFDYKDGKLSLTASRNADASSSGEGAVATIEFVIPENLAEGTNFAYSANATYVTVSAGNQSFAVNEQGIPVNAVYTIDVGTMVTGSSGTINVTDSNEKPVSDISIYLVNDSGNTLLGTTDSNGNLIVDTSTLCGENAGAGTVFTIFARGNDGVSYQYTGKSFAAGGNTDGTPSEIQLNATKDNITQKSITWISNPLKTQSSAVVRLMTADAYTSGSTDWNTVNGTSTLYAFGVSNDAARINSVMLSGLSENTKYAYQVGDGTIWSAVQYFTTDGGNSTTDFFVIGDTQMSGSTSADAGSIANVDGIANQLKTLNPNYSFGLQTGDFVDNGGQLPEWQEILDVFSKDFAGTDFIHVLGNHEYYGDASGEAARYIYNIPDKDKDYYSVQYGNVYVAVINNSANLNDAAAWLINDAKASNATWKVLTVHQPAYYTNILGSNEAFNKIIPPAADQAGINVVFCGHDHSYARTEPMTGGTVGASYDSAKLSSLKGDGTVYYICGDLGEKSRDTDYAITNNPAFHFAVATQNYTAVYLTVSASDDNLTVTTYDEATDKVIDTYTMYTSEAATN